MTDPKDMTDAELAEDVEDIANALEKPDFHNVELAQEILIEAARRLRASEPAWRPIETADHEATRETPVDIWVGKSYGRNATRYADATFWSMGSSGVAVYMTKDKFAVVPSHWMPLPTPPEPTDTEPKPKPNVEIDPVTGVITVNKAGTYHIGGYTSEFEEGETIEITEAEPTDT